MILIIGNMDKQLQNFVKNSKFKERMMIINKMCNVKTITDDVDVIIPFQIILKNGLVSNTAVHLEELVITLNVRKILYTNIYNKQIMEYLEKTYNVETEYFNLSDNSNNLLF